MGDSFGHRVKFRRTLDILCSKCGNIHHKEFDGYKGVQEIARALREEGFTLGLNPVCPDCKNKKRRMPYYIDNQSEKN